jgi:pimeloyl-ACP methyl ester carboxylesterase
MPVVPPQDIEPFETSGQNPHLNRRELIMSAGLMSGAGALGVSLAAHSASGKNATPSTAPAEIEALPPTPAPDNSWPGLNFVQGGKGYAPTPLGQVHYRDVGPRDARATMLLMHQTPASFIEFGAVQNSLARLGIRSVAVDTPGYGMSDQPSFLPTVGGFADNFVHVLDHLKVDRVISAGHHTGVCFATALAARHPDRVSGLVLHGCPLYDAETAADRRARKEVDRSPKPDGSHLLRLFSIGFKMRSQAEMAAWTLTTVTMFMEGPDIGHWAINRYDMGTDLASVKMPGLIITETDDEIHHLDELAHKLRPDFMYRVLGEDSFPAIFTDPDGWAKIAAEFIETAYR